MLVFLGGFVGGCCGHCGGDCCVEGSGDSLMERWGEGGENGEGDED